MSPVQSLDRAFDILETLSREKDGLALTEIGRRLGLPKSTVFRLLDSLGSRGYVERTSATGGYKLGLEFIELASLYLNNLDLKVEAQPFLMRLSHDTGKTVFLAILGGREMVYIDKSETFSSLRKYSVIGERRPLYCTALGKAYLSALDEAEARGLLTGVRLERMTPATATDIETVMARVGEARVRGWALDDREIEDNVRCVAAPILDYSARPIAALSVSWDIGAQPDADIRDIGARVMAAAKAISRRMGHGEGRGF